MKSILPVFTRSRIFLSCPRPGGCRIRQCCEICSRSSEVSLRVPQLAAPSRLLGGISCIQQFNPQSLQSTTGLASLCAAFGRTQASICASFLPPEARLEAWRRNHGAVDGEPVNTFIRPESHRTTLNLQSLRAEDKLENGWRRGSH